MALNHGIQKNHPMPPTTATTTPVSTPMAPAIIQSMPAVVGFQVFSCIAPVTCAPQLVHILVRGVVGAPHAGQKLVPAIGLAPQYIQNSGLPVNSLPQFLQNIASLPKRLPQQQYAANNFKRPGLYLNSPFPKATNIMASIPRINQGPMSAQIDPASANPQIFLSKA